MIERSEQLDSVQKRPVENRRAKSVAIQRFCRAGLFATLLNAVAAPATMAAPPPLPPLSEPASQEHHPGKVVFLQLVTPDLAAAKTFYGGLFGWTFRDIRLGETPYAEAGLNDRPVAGLFQRAIKPGEDRQPAWLAFISTSNVDSTTQAAQQRGTKVLFEPHDIPNLGRDAVLADPGEWIWSSLITTDPDTAAAFCQAVCEYEVFDLSNDKGAQHVLVASENHARPSVNAMPGDAVHAHP